MPKKSVSSIYEVELSFKSLINFFMESWRLFIFTVMLGLLGAIAYLWVTPKQYEAIAQIQLAQIGGGTTNPLGVNLEDPNLLISRLRLPTSYSINQIKACGFESEIVGAEYLAGNIRVSGIKGVNSVIELRMNGSDKIQLRTCVQSIFDAIKISQDEILKPFLEEAVKLLAKHKERLDESQSMVSRVDKSGAALSAAYLSNRDEIKYLTEEIVRLTSFIAYGEKRQAKLVAPISISHTPITPKNKISLVIGLMIGLFFGVILAIIKKSFAHHLII